jgi:hypothetical protein
VSILVFDPQPSHITAGQSSTIRYQVQNATAATLNGQALTIGANGSGAVTVMPSVTTPYVLAATDASGNQVTSPTTITVTTGVHDEAQPERKT